MILRYNREVETDDLSFCPKEVGIIVSEGALKEEAFPYDAEVGLTLTDDASIRDLNRHFRSIDRATDVLSFPLISYERAGDFSRIGEDRDNFSPETGACLLGDIVISIDHVLAQAKEYGHSEKREFAFLVAHSMLHLMGYDHMEDGERAVMEEKQDKILTSLGITRED